MSKKSITQLRVETPPQSNSPELTFEHLPRSVAQLHDRLKNIESWIFNTKGQQESDQLLTINEAAEFLHLTADTLYGKVHSKEIPYSKPGKRIYFSKTELIQWVKQGRKKTIKEIADESNTYLKIKGGPTK